MTISSVDPLVKTHPSRFRKEGKVHVQSNKQENKIQSNKQENKTYSEDMIRGLTKEEDKPSKGVLEQAIEQANQTMHIYRINLQFKLHEESGEFFVQVINSQTQEVIRAVPPEWVLDRVAYFKKIIGLIVDEII
ncbi:flagellar protein FlaG [Peptococcaceae bacterium]|nr:flagellar protein FlaG [Peptococcaceae bacterium]